MGAKDASSGVGAFGASQKQARPCVAYREVVRALAADNGARSETLADFRAHGGSPDRWQRSDREAMASALSRCEDDLEARARGRMTEARIAVRAVRRRLELEQVAVLESGQRRERYRHGSEESQRRIRRHVALPACSVDVYQRRSRRRAL